MTTYDYTFYMIQSIHEPSTYNYIGSSKNLPKRINLHKSKCYDETCKSKVYETMRLNGGWDAFEFIELEYHNMTEEKAHEHEQTMIDNIQPTLNTIKAWTGLTKEEYNNQRYIEHGYEIREQNKKYYVENIDKVKEQQQKWYIKNADKQKQHHKKYYTENVERLREQHNCECGGKYKTADKSIHFKTEKHKLYIADQHYKKQLFKRLKMAVKQNV